MRTEDRICLLEVQLRQAFLPSGESEEQLTALITMTRKLLKRTYELDEMLQGSYQRGWAQRERRLRAEAEVERLRTELDAPPDPLYRHRCDSRK